MEGMLTTLYTALPRLQVEVDVLQSTDNITACASDGACTARVITAMAQTKAQLKTLVETLSHVPRLSQKTVEAMWSITVNADGAMALANMFDVVVGWSKVLSMKCLLPLTTHYLLLTPHSSLLTTH